MNAAAAASPAAFPWDAAIGFGLGRLRLSPRDFWAMTPVELAAAWRALAGGNVGQAPDRAALTALMERYPD